MIDKNQADCHDGQHVTTTELWTAVDRFRAWLATAGGISFDPYDLMGTRYGCLARRLYYRGHPLGAVLTAPLVLIEILCPQVRALFVRKDRFATADAQLALGFLNLHEISLPQEEHGKLQRSAENRSAIACRLKAEELANEILRQSILTVRGIGWGYPFDWQSVNGLLSKGTPHITATPYCYEVFTHLFDLTAETQYRDVARSISEFVCKDLNDTPTGPNSAASSYTPLDLTKVVNASAYRAFVLLDAARRFDDQTYYEKALKNLRFILQSQQQDGSWLYAVDNTPERFIDHFHTCFVLKNLCKLNRDLQSDEVKRAIQNGYRYYRENLFDAEDNPKPFAIAPRIQIVRLEMYNVAEAITLGTLLKDDIPEAFELARTLGTRLIRRYQLPAGHWITRIYLGGISHTLPFLRWPQSQLFYALTNLLVALEQQSSDHATYSTQTARCESAEVDAGVVG